MEMDFTNYQDSSFDEYQKIYNSLATRTFAKLNKKENYYLSVILVDDDFIHRINKEYRHIDNSTDVISFAFLDDDEGLNNNEIIDLGEIIISTDHAKKQAEEYKHTLKREMSFLFVHGLLHLLGYDHQNIEEEKKMFSLQEEILGGRNDGQI